MAMKRIYHPTTALFRDVPEKDADDWKKAGWRFTNPGQVVARAGGIGPEKQVTDDFPYPVPAEPGEQPGTVMGSVPTLTTAADSPEKTSKK